jgi:membrane-associated phospholipid phosphatase
MKQVTFLLFLVVVFLIPVNLYAGKSGLEIYGNVAQFAIPGTAAVISLFEGEEPDTEGLLQLGISTLVTVGIVHGLKFVVDRERPEGTDKGSFPSGHTAAAFSGASYLHYRYGWQYGVPAYLAASVVGYSRVEADKHFVSDVVAGAAIANLMAFIFVDSIDENVVIVPIFETKKPNFGILMSIKF